MFHSVENINRRITEDRDYVERLVDTSLEFPLSRRIRFNVKPVGSIYITTHYYYHYTLLPLFSHLSKKNENILQVDDMMQI